MSYSPAHPLPGGQSHVAFLPTGGVAILGPDRTVSVIMPSGEIPVSEKSAEHYRNTLFRDVLGEEREERR
jgi:hypothetical protein